MIPHAGRSVATLENDEAPVTSGFETIACRGQKGWPSALKLFGSRFMYQPPPLRKVLPFPLFVATSLAVAIVVFAPELGPFAYVSAWGATFMVLTIWGILTYEGKK